MKRILFDENMPGLLRRDLPEFEVRPVQEEGWTGLNNSALLREAETTFDVLATVGNRLQHQQNIARFRMGIVVVSAQSTRLLHMRPLVPQLKQAREKRIPEPLWSWPRSNSSLHRTRTRTFIQRESYTFRRAGPRR